MADLGARAYRFSVSWPRVLPDGTGAVNQRGLDFYDRLVDALLAAGVQPLVNLFHWDLPQALQDRGGFADPRGRRLVHRLRRAGRVAPGRSRHRLDDLQRAGRLRLPRPCRRHPCAGPARLADGDPRRRQPAARPCRRRRGDPRAVDGAKIGIAIDVNQVAPATDSERDRRRRRPVERRSRRVVPRSAVRPRLPGARTRGAPRGGPPRRRRARRPAGRRSRLPGPELLPARLGQRPVGPRRSTGRSAPCRARSRRRWTGTSRPTACATRLLELHRTYAPREIVVTENGAAYPDTVDPDGRVRDDGAVDYLARHVAAAAEALAAGVPLTGYHVWSLLDNYEWSLGYTPAVRPRPRRLRDPAPDAQGQRALVPAAHRRGGSDRPPGSGLDGAGQDPSHEAAGAAGTRPAARSS